MTLKKLNIVDYDYIDPEDLSDFGTNGTHRLVRKPRWYGARFQMTILILLGACAMLCHSFLYSQLAGKESGTSPMLGFSFSEQIIVSAIGNTIASFATFTLGASIGIAFVQLLWTRLRRTPHTIQHIEAMLSCRTSPFSPAALCAWKAAWMLPLLAVLGSAMRLITIFAPGALRTEVSAVSRICAIPQADLSAGNFGIRWTDEGGELNTPSPELWRMVLQNLVSGSYIPPANNCGDCRYNTTFNAPSMNCTDITSHYNFKNMFTSSPTIWDAEIQSQPFTITVATIEAVDTSMQAVQCSVYNATYSTQISHNNTSTTVKVNTIIPHQLVNESNADATDYASTYWTASAALGMLQGLVQIDLRMMQDLISLDQPLRYNAYIVYSSLGQPGPSNTMSWTWNRSMLEALPELMTNISISLLSNPINAPMKVEDRPCVQSSVIYAYSPSHLYAAYGTGLTVSIMCVAVGFWSIRNNGREETIDFSRLLVAILNPEMLHEGIHEKTSLEAQQKGPNGCTVFSTVS